MSAVAQKNVERRDTSPPHGCSARGVSTSAQAEANRSLASVKPLPLATAADALRAVKAIWQSELPRAWRAVMTSLVHLAHKDSREINAHTGTIAKRAGYSVPAVNRTLAELRRAGFVDWLVLPTSRGRARQLVLWPVANDRRPVDLAERSIASTRQEATEAPESPLDSGQGDQMGSAVFDQTPPSDSLCDRTVENGSPQSPPSSARVAATEVGEGRGQNDHAAAVTRILAWYCTTLAGDNVASGRRRRAIARALAELAPALGIELAERECIAAIEGAKRRPTTDRDRDWDVWRVVGNGDRVLRLAKYARARAADDARERERRAAAASSPQTTRSSTPATSAADRAAWIAAHRPAWER